ncbi:MAG: hypothetical protein Q9208_001380 [Pyrenodesmia sp. 3 TL-2023]
MALRHRARPFTWVEISVGQETISLPNEIIKTYLPNLWRRQSGRLMASGNINLERLAQGERRNVRLALSIILNALEAAKANHGVASELRWQLHEAWSNHATDDMDPEQEMCTTFCDVVELLKPGSAFGSNDEMTYALSEWFTTLAAEGDLHPRTMFRYVKALDRLRTDMTGPVLALLRCYDFRQSDLQRWTRRRFFRPATLKKLRSLMRSRPREGSVAPIHGLIRGGDLDPEQIWDLSQVDPDSIIIDLDRLNRIGYAPYSDSESEDGSYIPFDEPYLPPIDPVGLGPHHLGFPHHSQRLMALPPRTLPYRCRSPRLIEHDTTIARPGLPRRLPTWHNTVPRSIL